MTYTYLKGLHDTYLKGLHGSDCQLLLQHKRTNQNLDFSVNHFRIDELLLEFLNCAGLLLPR